MDDQDFVSWFTHLGCWPTPKDPPPPLFFLGGVKIHLAPPLRPVLLFRHSPPSSLAARNPPGPSLLTLRNGGVPWETLKLQALRIVGTESGNGLGDRTASNSEFTGFRSRPRDKLISRDCLRLSHLKYSISYSLTILSFDAA
jgi:hypothetical protein